MTSDRDPRAPYKPECPGGARLISLTQGQWAIVDEGLYEWLMGWKWCAWWSKSSRTYYAVRGSSVAERAETGCPMTMSMHRKIMGVEYSSHKIEVDHIHHETLDNRVSQLALVTSRKNKRNLKNAGSSKYSNVCFVKARCRWQVDIRVKGGPRVCMGWFKDEDDAGAFAEVVHGYVDVYPKCTAQDLKDLRAKLKAERRNKCQR